LTTQASTKVYKSPGARGGNVIEPLAARDGKVSSQTTTASVATNGLLVFAPAHVAAFAGARFENANAFYLQEGANLVAVDALAAGRIEPANERWQFSRATSATEVFFRDQLAYRDAYDLQPIPGLPTPAQLLADMNFQSTVLIIGPALRSLVETATSLTQQTGGLLVSASSLLRLPDSMPGCVVRVLATEVAAGNACIETLLAPALVPLLGGNPWRRTF
jgi:urease accessory protein UreH